MDIGDLDMILGILWLTKEDLIIRWKKEVWVYPFQKDTVFFVVTKKEMKRTVKETRSVFVCYITSKPTQAEEEREESNNQIPLVSKKRIPEEYKDLERVFLVAKELVVL